MFSTQEAQTEILLNNYKTMQNREKKRFGLPVYPSQHSMKALKSKNGGHSDCFGVSLASFSAILCKRFQANA